MRTALKTVGRWDAFALIVIFAFIMGIGSLLSNSSYKILTMGNTIDLSPAYLPYYAMRSVARMFIALILSIISTFTFGTWMAKSIRAEKILLPLVDILQSVPVLAFLQMAIWGLGSMMSNPSYAFEFAAILAIFTSQVWNMILVFYQSLKGIPEAWIEMAAVYQFSSWQRFWRIEVPYALPELVSNTMMSLSAGWFFVVASEAITTHGRVTYLPGLGSYIYHASICQDSLSLYYAMLALFLVILAYNQLIFRPTNYWIYKQEHSEFLNPPWVIKMFQKVTWLRSCTYAFRPIWENWVTLFSYPSRQIKDKNSYIPQFFYYAWIVGLLSLALGILIYTMQKVDINELGLICLYGLYTTTRIFIMIIISALIWVPTGIIVGRNPRLARISQPILQFLAAFPAYIVYPFASHFIQVHNLNPNIWLSPLLVMGTQWYILFNVIVAVQRFPKGIDEALDLLSASTYIRLRSWIMPGIFPMLIIGLNNAAGGAWNASIEAEMIIWGGKAIAAEGLGTYIRMTSDNGQLINMTLATVIMCILVTVINRFLWMPLIYLAQRKYQIREEI